MINNLVIVKVGGISFGTSNCSSDIKALSNKITLISNLYETENLGKRLFFADVLSSPFVSDNLYNETFLNDSDGVLDYMMIGKLNN